jgi:hypothetical protein
LVHFARRGQFTHDPDLPGPQFRLAWQRVSPAGVLKRQSAAREVGAGVALELEFKRFRSVLQPESTDHPAFLTVVDLAA